jgi:hypothetical protein
MYSTAIAEDGSYQFVAVPAGAYVVTITTLGPKKKDDKKEPPKLPPIPAKYGDPKTSGLTIMVKEGKNAFDIDLKSR